MANFLSTWLVFAGIIIANNKVQLIETFVSRFQSFLSLIRLHSCAAILFRFNLPNSFMYTLIIIKIISVFAIKLEALDSIPVLCYHQVVPTPKGLYEVSVENFRIQLAYLQKHGYQTINSAQLLDILRRQSSFIKKPIVITFDDGYKSVFSHAFPIMKEFGFIGVVCVYPQFLNSNNAMSWNDLKVLASAGWSIECHSLTHANLIKIPAQMSQKSFLEKEILHSKEIIEQYTGQSVRFMVWPYGIYSTITEDFARKVGYHGAMTVDGGANYPGLDPFRVKRQVIYRTDDLSKFAIRVELAALEVHNHIPAPGAIVTNFASMSCEVPLLTKFDSKTPTVNVKISGGSLDFKVDQARGIIEGKPRVPMKSGSHFIDVYIRNPATGVTHQHGWLFTIK